MKILTIPLRVVSEMNLREHWTKRHKRKKQQQLWVMQYWKSAKVEVTLPAHIILTRISPRKFDSDNLVGSFKHVRDAVADLITPGLAPGRADDVKGLTFAYDQFKGEPKEYAIRITLILG